MRVSAHVERSETLAQRLPLGESIFPIEHAIPIAALPLAALTTERIRYAVASR